jgi:hypothetical protein
MRRQLSTALIVVSAIGLTVVEASQLRLPSLDGGLVDPFAVAPGLRAVVLVFISADCPISNRYAPELRRLQARFDRQGIAFRFVYPNPAELPSAIGRHLAEYGYQGTVLRDPRQALVAITGVTVTPEAAVYDSTERLVYRGRIDDRYVSPGLQRPQPTSRDLEQALTAILVGAPVPRARTPAVGCFIADFAR